MADKPTYRLVEDDEALRSWNTEEYAARILKANREAPHAERVDYCTSELKRRLERAVNQLARDHGLTRDELIQAARRVLDTARTSAIGSSTRID